jgi:RPA family protein
LAENKIKREVAWRIFAKEFNSATVELPSEDQYTPTYLLSPLGTLINRVYITGVLTECENIGTGQEPLWRGRVSDPTDVFYISAGQYQPKAARILADIEVPALVGIVGKARTYKPDDLTVYVSIRVEMIKQITQELRDYWVLEACQGLTQRMNCITEALRMDPPDIKKLTSLGYNTKISSGVIEAINQYGSIDIQEYSGLLVTTLKELNVETGIDRKFPEPGPGRTTKQLESDSEPLVQGEETISPEAGDIEPSLEFATALDMDKDNKSESFSKDDSTTETSADSDNDDDIKEQLVFEIITSLVEDTPDGVIYEDVQARATEQGLERAEVEEHISSLIEKGVIYEPTIGVFKAV